MSTYRVVPLSSVSAPQAPLRNAMDLQALEELARSIAKVGLLQPLTVVEAPNGYEVKAGHRRLQACRMLGLAEVAVIVRTDDSEQAAAVMMVENLQRADLTPVEESRALQKMRDVLGMSVEAMAGAVSRSEAWVRGRLELLAWPVAAVEAVSEGRASVAALRPLVEIENEVERDRLLSVAIESGATAAVTRSWAAQAQGMAAMSPETMGSRSQALVDLGNVVVSMPCWSCREPRDAMSLAVVRICRACVEDVERQAAAVAASQAAAGAAS